MRYPASPRYPSSYPSLEVTTMNPEIQGYSDFIDMLLEKADSHAASLSTDALNWQPLDADTNSVAALCAHMCGVVRWWVQQGLTGNDVGRQRDTEFVATVDDNGNLSFWGTRRPISDVISETRAISREILANLDSCRSHPTERRRHPRPSAKPLGPRPHHRRTLPAHRPHGTHHPDVEGPGVRLPPN